MTEQDWAVCQAVAEMRAAVKALRRGEIGANRLLVAPGPPHRHEAWETRTFPINSRPIMPVEPRGVGARVPFGARNQFGAQIPRSGRATREILLEAIKNPEMQRGIWDWKKIVRYLANSLRHEL